MFDKPSLFLNICFFEHVLLFNLSLPQAVSYFVGEILLLLFFSWEDWQTFTFVGDKEFEKLDLNAEKISGSGENENSIKIDSIAVSVFVDFLTLENTETAAATPLERM